MDKKVLSKNPSFLWALTGGLIGIGVFIILLTLGYLTRMSSSARQPVPPAFTILPGPSATPVQADRADSISQPVPTTSPSKFPTPEGSISLGQLVEVFGTGGDGLRLRTQPNLDGGITFLIVENEVLKVEDGPIEGDGYLWWYLVNPYDSSTQGWAAANYLRSFKSP